MQDLIPKATNFVSHPHSPALPRSKSNSQDFPQFHPIQSRDWTAPGLLERVKMSNQPQQDGRGVVLGVDGGTTSTTCVCIRFLPRYDVDDLPILGRAIAGCTNHNSVGEDEANNTLKKVLIEALSKSRSAINDVRAVSVGISGVNHPSDQERLFKLLRQIFPTSVKLYVHNDAVAALCSGTLGKLHGCVLISGTGSISYGCTEDGREVRSGGGGPILGDWGSGYGISAQALTAVLRAHDGRGPPTMLTSRMLDTLPVSSPDEIIGWAYEDPAWAHIAALVPVVVSCAEAGDKIANGILADAVKDLAECVKAVIRRLNLCGEDGSGSCPVVLVGGVLVADNKKWDMAKEVMELVNQDFPGAYPIKPKVEPAVGAALLPLYHLRNGSESLN